MSNQWHSHWSRLFLIGLLTSITITAKAKEPTPLEEELALVKDLDPWEKKYLELCLQGTTPLLDADNFKEFATGDIGELGQLITSYTGINRPAGQRREYGFTVNQVVSDNSFLTWNFNLYVEGVALADVTDEEQVSLKGLVFAVTGTKRYKTATGLRTVKKLLALDTSRADAVLEKVRSLREWRTWADKTGKHSVLAKYLKYSSGKVHLEKRDGKIIQLSITKLSKKDRDWVKEEQKRQVKLKQKKSRK